jgi:signal transduction histidine kinase
MSLSPHIRIERLIIFSRIGLAMFSWLAARLDPFEPSITAALTHNLLEAYLAYSWFLLPLLWALPLQAKFIGMVSHFVDVLVITLLITLTQGSASPFFTYFVFALFAAALRWQKSGIMWSATAFLCLYSGSSIFLELEISPHSGSLELNRFIMRNVHLALVALLLTYLTTYEKQIRQELGRLSEWPLYTPSTNDAETFIRDILAYAANTLETPRLLMLWEEKEEPIRHLAVFGSEQFHYQTIPPTTHQSLIHPSFSDCHFLCNDASLQSPKILCATARGLEYRICPLLDPELVKQHHIRAVIGLALNGQTFQGRLLLLDKPTPTSDDLSLGILAAQQVATRMDQFFLHAQQQKTAAIDERIKMARDLHDGVLQTLTGIALQVKNIGRTLESDTTAARKDLGQLQALIQTEQRNLRQFIQQLKPATVTFPINTSSLELRLQELANTIRQQWQLDVQVTQLPSDSLLAGSSLKEIYHLIREALINCARHAHASHVKVVLQLSEDRLNIHIADDGDGFPFHGVFELEDLTVLQLGPKTIIERIRALHGTLRIHSDNNGASLEISLPFTTNTIAQNTHTDLSNKDWGEQH